MVLKPQDLSLAPALRFGCDSGTVCGMRRERLCGEYFRRAVLEGRRSMAGPGLLAGRFLTQTPGWRAGVVVIAGVAVACLAIGRGGAADDKKETTPKSGKVAAEKRTAEAAKDGDEAPANPPESD